MREICVLAVMELFGFVAFARAPSTANCTISPSEIVAGDPLIAAMTTPFSPDHSVINYVWSTTGGKSLGLGATTNLDTVGLAPGSYTATGTATDPREKT